MKRKRESPFQQPAELALSAALANASARQPATRGEREVDPAVVMPDLTTGKADEESSTVMNDIMTDVEAKFDEIYLNYPRHKQMQLAIDRIRQHGIKVRGTGRPMRGLLVTGPTGSGKTTGIVEYVAHLIREGAYAEGRMPVLYLRLRKKVTVMKLLRAILREFGDRHALRRDEDELIEQVRNCIERGGVEVIVIDECQHLRNKSTDSLEVTDQLKTFLDDGIAPVVFVGVKEAQEMFDENLQLAGRCADPIKLAPLDPAVDDDVALLTKFLELLDKEMVARKLTSRPSSLGSPYIVTCLHLASAGVIGQAYRIVRAALLIATSREALFVETYDLSLAVERWAMRNKVCTYNPFLRADLQAAFENVAA
jgi:hypothetical protein